MADKFLKYGLSWPNSIHPAKMELEVVRHGGQWKDKHGRTCGNGTLFHFREFIKSVWPWVKFHKWIDLFIESYLEYRTIGVLGPASSGKTFDAALCTVADWYCFSDQTTVICCSTTREMLENRVWGEIKRLHKDAQSRIEWLPGHLIEGRLRIISDPKKDAVDGRDFRNGMQGVPCFLTGTLVDTPHGSVPIESVKVGDSVVNACGVGVVSDVHKRTATRLVKVSLSNSRVIECTSEHPFLTKRGWVKAMDLETSDMVLSVRETLRLLRDIPLPSLSESEILLRQVQQVLTPKNVHSVRDKLPSVAESFSSRKCLGWSLHGKILLKGLCRKMGGNSQRMFQDNNSEMCSLRATHGQGSFLKKLLLSEMSFPVHESAVRAVREGVPFDSGISEETAKSVLRESMSQQSHWKGKCKKAGQTYTRRIECLESVSQFDCASSFKNWIETQKRESALVSTGHCFPGYKTGGRDRRWNPQRPRQITERQIQNCRFEFAWVDGVEVLESRSDPRFNESAEGYTVHNLEVEGHPSYSVHGVIVHNCKKGENYLGLGDFIGIKNKRVRLIGDELHLLPRVFVDSLSNLDKNPDFKAVGLGNPKDTIDALGVFAEPAADLGGWDSGIDQTPVTKSWRTRRPQGICLQFPGPDSPNLDGKLGIPLITQEAMDRDISFYGTESLWYTMMNLGAMPRGQGSRRVLTRQMCLKFGAMEEPNWKNSNRVKIGFLDAAYRGVGGDRCVFGWLEYGEEVPPLDAGKTLVNLVTQQFTYPVGRKIIALKEMMLVPIVGGVGDDPEDQIATFVKGKCEEIGITPQHFFYDSGMRTSLVQAFSRLWSPYTSSVDCGGSASERKVSADINVLCKDYYSKFITELWFSVRLIVEARQFRGMTEEVMNEFCSREWTMVGANKIEAEPKAKMKVKTGRSPDLSDAVAIGCHGAVMSGFEIMRLGTLRNNKNGEGWKRDLEQRAKAIRSSKELHYQA